MSHGLFGCYVAHALARPLAEWSARRGKRDFLDRVRLSEVEQLERGAVLGIHRNHDGTRFGKGSSKDIPGRDHTFLVGKCDRRAAACRCECRLERRRSNDGDHDEVACSRRGLTDGFGACGNLDVFAAKCRFQIVVAGLIGNRHKTRAKAARLFGERVDLRLRRERLDGKSLISVALARVRPRDQSVVQNWIHGWPPQSGSTPNTNTPKAARGAANRMESIRSRTPPWPGMSPPLFLRPTRRF